MALLVVNETRDAQNPRVWQPGGVLFWAPICQSAACRKMLASTSKPKACTRELTNQGARGGPISDKRKG